MPSVEEFKHRNYYQRLGVSAEATLDEIKEAYRDIARVYHPDSTFYGDLVKIELTEDDDAIFQMATAAYNTLIREDTRRSYDSSLQTVAGVRPEEPSPSSPAIKGAKDWEAKPKSKTPTPQMSKVRIRKVELQAADEPAVTRGLATSQTAQPAVRYPEPQPGSSGHRHLFGTEGSLETSGGRSRQLVLAAALILMAAIVAGASLLLLRH